MTKDYINDYDTTAGNNEDIGGISIIEGCAPSNINDAIREGMSHLAAWKSEFEVGADIASATALPVNVPGQFHDVTGTTTITSFAEATNDTSRIKVLQFDGILTLTHHATDLVLLTGANRTTAAGNIGIYYQYAAGDWREVYFSDSSSDLVDDLTPQLGGDLDGQGNEINSISGLFIDEAANAAADVAGDGQFWVKDDTPNTPMFTDDEGNDYLLTARLETEQASTSGTAISFAGIPAGVTEITVMLEQVSTNGTSDYIIQIGDSGGYEASGYTGGCAQDGTAGRVANSNGFNIENAPVAGVVCDAVARLTLKDAANNTWMCTGTSNDGGNNSNYFFSGAKSLSSVLDRVQVTTDSGSNSFDAGSINILYR